MNYTSQYNRGQLGVDHPELNNVISIQSALNHRFGRKRYNVHKNMQSSGIFAQHYMPKQLSQPLQRHSLPAPPVSEPSHTQNYSEKQLTNQPGPPAILTAQDQNLYLEEINRLRAQLRQKQNELFQSSQTPQPEKKTPSTPAEYFNRVNKSLFDKQRMEQQDQIRYRTIQYQIAQKQKLRVLDQMQKENEKTRRLEDLKKLKQEEIERRVESMKKAREYRQHLDFQAQLQRKITQQEEKARRTEYIPPAEIAPIRPSQPPVVQQVDAFQKHVNSFYEPDYSTPPRQYHTKRTPKTLCYDPITGSLKDTSPYLYGPLPRPTPNKTQINPFLSPQKNLSELPNQYAGLPAFQQPLYTRAHPKFSPSFPVTGNSQLNPVAFKPEYQRNLNQFYGSDPVSKPSSNLAEYGSYMLKPQLSFKFQKREFKQV